MATSQLAPMGHGRLPRPVRMSKSRTGEAVLRPVVSTSIKQMMVSFSGASGLHMPQRIRRNPSLALASGKGVLRAMVPPLYSLWGRQPTRQGTAHQKCLPLLGWQRPGGERRGFGANSTGASEPNAESIWSIDVRVQLARLSSIGMVAQPRLLIASV